MFLGFHSLLFKTNKFVRVFIISELLLWSSWNFVIPIFAIFVAEDIPGGSIQIAATAFSLHLLIRIFAELVSGKLTSKLSDVKKFTWVIAGLFFVTFSFLGFIFANDVATVFISYGLLGLGLGISSPAKYAAFSKHLDKSNEPSQWGLYNAITFSGMAVSGALGGFIAGEFGFKPLFLIAALTSLLASIPYFIYLRKRPDELRFS